MRQAFLTMMMQEVVSSWSAHDLEWGSQSVYLPCDGESTVAQIDVQAPFWFPVAHRI